MRFVVFGAGAIGGVLGARLHQAGSEVTLIARGPHYEAIRRSGLRLETPEETSVLEIDAVEDPAKIDWRGDEAVLLTMKTQDTLAAVSALRAGAPPETPVVCVQNAVENERIALRRFENVYGAVVMSPTAHMEPGVVQAFGTRMSGVIDLGRYPDGVDDKAREIAGAIDASHFDSQPRRDIMRFKYAKLIMNLGNAVGAVVRPGPERDELIEQTKGEGRRVLDAAGIDHDAADVSDALGRWQRYGVRDIPGQKRGGSSTWQSFARGTGGIETDYLNGEIVLLGRLHGVPTPINEALCALADRHLREHREPQTLEPGEVLTYAAQRHPSWTR